MDVVPPKNESEYLERMSKAIFSAGLNWKMIDNKWPDFRTAFAGFSPEVVAKFPASKVRELMRDSKIVRNEKKIRATIENAKEILAITKEHGSFKKYIQSFGKDEEKLQGDLRARFGHLGPSSARMFLWSVGYPLTPNKEEKAWMAGQKA
jgi:3-methyladenine DNA glycosylase Tag